MTIEFNCPNCGALIAFDSQHAGRRARCLSCGQKFIIPSESFQKPEKIAPEPEPKGEPIPGFARAAFVDTCKVFVDPKNVTPLAFVVAVVSFRFFLAQPFCGVDYISAIITWGWLCGFYLNVIYQTAFDDDQLPEIYLGTSVTFLYYVFQPFWAFFFALAMVEIPFFISLWLTHGFGITLTNFHSTIGPLHLLVQFLFILGLFAFPAAILATAVAKDFALLRPDYLFAPAFRALFPYAAIVLMLAAACFLQFHVDQYTPDAAPATTILHLTLNLLVQVIAISAMRGIGLFYRHYGCYFRW